MPKMERASQDQVRDTWQGYWESADLGDYALPRLSTFQVQMLEIVKEAIESSGGKRILAAGCGQDFVAAYLQRDAGNGLALTLLDIAPKVLEYNSELFRRNGLKCATVEGSIFEMPFPDGSFDVIFNTGLMEHFTPEDQTSMIHEVIRLLAPGGRYVTANPSDAGVIYKYGMGVAKERGTWPFGVEVPVKSLKFVRNTVPGIRSIEERPFDFAGQLYFLSFIHPALGYLSAPIRIAARSATVARAMDATLGRVFGTYLLASVFERG